MEATIDDNNTAARPPSIPGEALLSSIKDVYDRGWTLEAFRQASAFAPLSAWKGAEACVIAARIATHVGNHRLSTKLTARAWRLNPRHPDAWAQYGYEIGLRRGPLALWRVMRGCDELPDATAEQRAELLGLQGRAAADLRDFGVAEGLLSRAESLDPARAWIRLQSAYLLEAQDRVEEALRAARESCALHPHPFYRAGVQTTAHLLQLLDRDDEAIQLLCEADAALQNGPLAAQLYSLLSENGGWSQSESALERFVELSPLLDVRGQQWVAAQRVRVAYHAGRRDDAARLAATIDDDFHRAFAARLVEAPTSTERLLLDVTFVRQHFKTCAPATLAAIGQFWQFPAEHLRLAEAICYDGTPHWQQRSWAEKNGWYVRSFRATKESAVALLERGIPFAITTVEATSAHMMAVVGIDRVRDSLLLRDPGQPYVIESAAGEFFARYRPFGPRGTVFVPVQERARLDGVTLPDADQYDDYHRVAMALESHDRAAAAEAVRAMDASAPADMLTLDAHLDLATYDSNLVEQRRCLDALLQLFPGNAARLLRRFACLRDASREERILFLDEACATADADPALLVALGRALLGDARSHARARRWLRRALRRRPLDATAISALADLEWEGGALDEAAELYRIAANIESFHEQLYRTWFVLCRRTRRAQQALSYLQDRFARFGRFSDQPALTLAWAWQEMEQPARAREVLQEAMRLRPDAGVLLLRAARLLADIGEAPIGESLLDSARGRVRENDWLRARAEMAESRSDAATALRSARDLLQREPLALDAHGIIVRTLARHEGVSAALAHLQDAAVAFPHHYGLRRMITEWSHHAGPEATESAAAELLRLEPSDAWARRERALALMGMSRGDEAMAEAAEAAHIEPRHSYSFSILGHVCRRFGAADQARAHFRHAVELSVDNSDAITALLELARSDRERRDELAFVEAELIRQVVTGDGLLVYLEAARPILEPEALLRNVEQAQRERPDLWHAWSALVSQFGHLGRLDEACTTAEQATRVFPHLARTWLDLATVHRWRNDPAGEIEAARQAFEINPAWPTAAGALSDALERNGRLDEARVTYSRALQHAPQSASLHAFLASLLWRQRESEAALEEIECALRLAPAYDWAWQRLAEWALQAGQPERTANFARTLTGERPGDPRIWLVLARMLTGPESISERLAAIDRAIAIDPGSTNAWDAKAEMLAGAERFDAAIQACTDGDTRCRADVHVLRGRHAWIEAQRNRLPEAIQLMRGLLAENGSYVWGWHQLSSWLLDEGSLPEAAEALERLQRLCPYDAWVNRELGFLRLKEGASEPAEQAFATALRAVPTDVAAAHNLIDLQFQAANLAGATTTLQLMQVHQPGAATLAVEARLLLEQRDEVAAVRVLETLCASPDPDPWPLDAVTAAFQRGDRTSTALRVLRSAIKTRSCNPEVGAAAIRLLLDRRSPVAATWLFAKLAPGENQRRAAAPLVEGLGELKANWTFRWLMWRRRKAIVEDDATWGQAGLALIRLDRCSDAAAWLSDWRHRTDVKPWMLFNLCLGLRHQGRYGEANRVATYVLETWGHRDGSDDMHLFLAVEEALAGQLSAADGHLEHVVARDDVQHDRQLLALARALVQFQRTPPADRRKKYREIRAQLAPDFGPRRMWGSMRDVRRTFRRASRVFHREGAGVEAALSCEWTLNWHRIAIGGSLLIYWSWRLI